jgi:hypothetical protein
VKIAVITALSGNRERLYDPRIAYPGVDYYAFVDSPQNVSKWIVKPLLHFTMDKKYEARRNAKPYKLAPHLFVPDYDFYIWHDVSHELVGDPYLIVKDYFSKEQDIALFRHTQRNCLYHEATELKKLMYDKEENINRQILFYRDEGMPENNGLYELSAFVRKNNEKTQALGLAWMEHINRFSSRDQLSLNFLVWKMGIAVSVLPGYCNGFNSRGGIGNNEIMPQVRGHVSSGPQ